MFYRSKFDHEAGHKGVIVKVLTVAKANQIDVGVGN